MKTTAHAPLQRGDISKCLGPITLDGFYSRVVSGRLFKYDLCLGYGGVRVKVADADYKKINRGRALWWGTRESVKNAQQARGSGEGGRKRAKERDDSAHVRSYTCISRVRGRLSSRWLQILPHDDRGKVETLEYHHLSQQRCRPQAGFTALSPIRYCKWCTLVPSVLALQQTLSLGLLHENNPTIDYWLLL